MSPLHSGVTTVAALTSGSGSTSVTLLNNSYNSGAVVASRLFKTFCPFVSGGSAPDGSGVAGYYAPFGSPIRTMLAEIDESLP